MKRIEEVSFKNHQLFGDGLISFCLDRKSPYDTIVIIGENGSGKTALMNYLYGTMASTSYINMPVDYLESTIRVTLDEEGIKTEPDEVGQVSGIELAIIYRNSNGGQKIDFCSNGYNYKNVRDNTTKKINGYAIGGLISDVDITFNSSAEVRGVTNKTLDANERELENDKALAVEQLLVDIYNQDNSLLADYSRSHPHEAIPEEVFSSQRINRFSEAYKKIFGSSIILEGVKDNTHVMFKKGDTMIDIRDLSSGEKQIVYRTAYLLRNIGVLAGVPVFIDEPEISMHPKWEKQIYDYYRSLFSVNGRSVSQLFMATHSEYVIEAALKDERALIISMKDGRAVTVERNSFILPTITSAEIQYHVFGIPNVDYHTQLFNYIGEKIAEKNNVTCVDKILISNGATRRESRGCGRRYDSLSAFIRNQIHHAYKRTFSESDLKVSIEDMLRTIRAHAAQEKSETK